ncbi:MAG: hypothetical protein J6U38_04945 [Clostridia bacterium]|nr:hypothetical protein [Clostridia bacterium]
MAANYEAIMNDFTGDETQAIGYDPLNLRQAVIGDLMGEVTGGYNIVEGHFFCPDSTVTISYLAPAFKGLDSWAAREFNKLMTAAVTEFRQANPDVDILYHGDPIGSVSNATKAANR